MLIGSERHTKDDLELWRELESVDMVRRVDVSQSMRMVRHFGQCYCSVSWGKDSVAIAWLVASQRLDIPIVWVRPVGAEMPYCEDVRDAFLSIFPHVDYRECEVESELWNDPNVSNEKAFLPARIAAGTRRRIVGVRAAESATRWMSIRHHGLETKDVSRPIGWWSTDDVFAVLAQNNLPVHPSYAMLGSGRYKRKHRRVDSLGGQWGDQFGRNEWEMEYFPDIINRIKHAASKSNR